MLERVAVDLVFAFGAADDPFFWDLVLALHFAAVTDLDVFQFFQIRGFYELDGPAFVVASRLIIVIVLELIMKHAIVLHFDLTSARRLELRNIEGDVSFKTFFIDDQHVGDDVFAVFFFGAVWIASLNLDVAAAELIATLHFLKEFNHAAVFAVCQGMSRAVSEAGHALLAEK